MSVPSDEVLRRLGASLREIDPRTLAVNPEEGAVRWFLGDSGTELIAWTRGGSEPAHLQLTLDRLQLEWTRAKGLVIRRFKPGGSSAGGRYDGYLLGSASPVDPAIRAAAKALLLASPVPAQLCAPLLRALDRGE